MTDKQLSPAAQAVLDATFPTYDCEALYSLTEEQHAGMIAAAALRAAAEKLGYMIYDYENNEHPSVVNVADIFAIANELEGK